MSSNSPLARVKEEFGGKDKLVDKLVGLVERRPNPPRVLAAFSSGELGLALGAENVIHTAFLAGRAADRWAQDALRLSGFCPLLPESWREEP